MSLFTRKCFVVCLCVLFQACAKKQPQPTTNDTFPIPQTTQYKTTIKHSPNPETIQHTTTIKPNPNWQRHALLIGNESYSSLSKLYNPVLDVDTVGKKLKAMGFLVRVEKNLQTKQEIQKVINDFKHTLKQDDLSLFYYAGHGIGLNGKNYLLPTNFDAKDVDEVDEQGYNLTKIEDILVRRGAEGLLLIDACRNEFTPTWKTPQRGQRPLAMFRTQLKSGSVSYLYSTQDGSFALDGVRNEMSPFAQAIHQYIDDKDRFLDFQMKVRNYVQRKTGGQQTPVLQTISTDTVFFHRQPIGIQQKIAENTIPADVALRGSTWTPQKKALIVAVSTYNADLTPNINSMNDIGFITDTLSRLGYKKESIAILQEVKSDNQTKTVTKSRFLSTMDKFIDTIAEGDQVFWSYSGRTLDNNALMFSNFDKKQNPKDLLSRSEIMEIVEKLRLKTGTNGSVTILFDSCCIFSQSNSQFDFQSQLIPEEKAPVVWVEGCTRGGAGTEMVFLNEQSAGLLSQLTFSFVDSASPNTRWSELKWFTPNGAKSQVKEFLPGYVKILGDGETLIKTGKYPNRNKSTIPIDRTNKYGTNSVFLNVGQMDGLFPGTEVLALYKDGTKGPQGSIVQTSMIRARVELQNTPKQFIESIEIVRPALPKLEHTIKGTKDLSQTHPGITMYETNQPWFMRWDKEFNYWVLINDQSMGVSPPIPVKHSLAQPLIARWSYVTFFYEWLKRQVDKSTDSIIIQNRTWIDELPRKTNPSIVRSVALVPKRKAIFCADNTLPNNQTSFFSWSGTTQDGYLVLLRHGSDGSLTNLDPFGREIALQNAQKRGKDIVITTCAQLTEGESIVAIRTPKPWNPNLLSTLTQKVPFASFTTLPQAIDEVKPKGLYLGKRIELFTNKTEEFGIAILPPPIQIEQNEN